MTVSNVAPLVTYAGNGSTSAFNVPFKFAASSRSAASSPRSPKASTTRLPERVSTEGGL
jgi:hypothetical protein